MQLEQIVSLAWPSLLWLMEERDNRAEESEKKWAGGGAKGGWAEALIDEVVAEYEDELNWKYFAGC